MLISYFIRVGINNTYANCRCRAGMRVNSHKTTEIDELRAAGSQWGTPIAHTLRFGENGMSAAETARYSHSYTQYKILKRDM